MKITVIGGGSSYTPELTDGLIDRSEHLGIDALWLHDIDKKRLGVVADFTRRMAGAKGRNGLAIKDTVDLNKAVSDADFVIAQIRVGGNEARREDERLGMRHGLIGQETTGVGGFAKALRTVPAMLDICRALEKKSPRAFLINFTNPSGLVTEAILKHTQVRGIGLCNIPITFHFEIAAALGATRKDVDFDYVGLNHLSWVTGLRLRGRDVLKKVLKWAGSAARPANLEDLEYPPELIKALGMIPMHYLRYYYMTDLMIEKQQAKQKTRADEVIEIERELFEIYKDKSVCEKPEKLSKRGGAHYSLAALELIESIHFNRDDTQILDVMNGGAVHKLPGAAVVEVACKVNRHGAFPMPVRTPPPEIVGLMRAVKAYEELAVDAAVNSSYDKALLALVAHPLGPDGDKAKTVLDDIIETHKIKLK